MHKDNTKYYKYLFIFFLVVLIAQRLIHLLGRIEEPLAWRQFDTEFYAYDFYKNGIDLFKPSVSWMGGYKTTILEFPLISGVISVFYLLFEPSVFIARSVIFVFFLGSAFYLYKLFAKLYYRSLASIILLVYLLLPLSIYYSRAVNIDFPVMFFSLSALYYFIIAIDSENYHYIILGVFLSTLAFLIKAPYVFIIYFPLSFYIISKKKIQFAFKAAPLMVIPLIIFYFWYSYTILINSNSPDWYFIPDYFKFTNMSSWYFGDLDQRFDYNNWERLATRFGASGITFVGLPFFIIGLFVKPASGFSRKFMFWYSAGTIVYLLIFFSLNIIHDYYQIPLIVISTMYIATGIDYIFRKINFKKVLYDRILLTFRLISLSVNGIWFTERWYYKPDNIRHSAAELIYRNTEPDELVIASIDLTDPRDPRILAPSRRYGWAIRISDLNRSLIERLQLEGANYLSVTGTLKNDSLKKYLETLQIKEKSDLGTNTIFTLYKLK
jgi:hypothetical protein